MHVCIHTDRIFQTIWDNRVNLIHVAKSRPEHSV